MSTIERYSRTIPASGAIENGRGNVFLLVSATGSVNVRLENGGAAEGINGAIGGVRVERRRPWDNLRILGTAGVTVEYWIGSQDVERDLVDVFTQIATIAGVAAVSIEPAASVADTPAVAAASGAQSVLFAANLLRRRLKVYADSLNAGSCYARTAGGANNIAELQPGGVFNYDGRYGLDVRNDTGAVANFYIFEEA